jgi:hypothetical protein
MLKSVDRALANRLISFVGNSSDGLLNYCYFWLLQHLQVSVRSAALQFWFADPLLPVFANVYNFSYSLSPRLRVSLR